MGITRRSEMVTCLGAGFLVYAASVACSVFVLVPVTWPMRFKLVVSAWSIVIPVVAAAAITLPLCRSNRFKSPKLRTTCLFVIAFCLLASRPQRGIVFVGYFAVSIDGSSRMGYIEWLNTSPTMAAGCLSLNFDFLSIFAYAAASHSRVRLGDVTW